MLFIYASIPSRRSLMVALVSVFLFLPLLLSQMLEAQSKTASADDRVQDLYAEAKSAQASGDLNGAIAKYESILQISPRLGAAYNNLGSLT